jgi:hypothetical protein
MKEDFIIINGKKYDREKLPSELTFTLRKPLEIGGHSVPVLELQEPNAGEYEQYCKAVANGNHAGAMIKLITLVTCKSNQDLSEPFIKQIGMRDMNEISEYLTVFMIPGQATETSL